MTSTSDYERKRRITEEIDQGKIELIQNVCTRLGHPDRIQEMKEIYIDKTHGGLKKKKDENAPKPARNAYQFFCEEIRPRIKKDNPTLKMPAHSTLMSIEWRQLSEKAKEPFQKQADDDKVRYAADLKQYEESLYKFESSTFVGTGSQNAAGAGAGA